MLEIHIQSESMEEPIVARTYALLRFNAWDFIYFAEWVQQHGDIPNASNGTIRPSKVGDKDGLPENWKEHLTYTDEMDNNTRTITVNNNYSRGDTEYTIKINAI